MSEPVTCFLVERTMIARYWLRRFQFTDKKTCPATGSFHNAMKLLGDFPYVDSPDYGGVMKPLEELEPARSDPRWPPACEKCGAAFAEDDQWQLFFDPLYERRETGEHWPLRKLPAGAMWDAFWLRQFGTGPDGLALCLMLPGGFQWHIDGQAVSGGNWTREGTPPRITARPSILVPGRDGAPDRYHGWLTDGILSPI